MRIMRDHIEIARRFTGIETNTAYSFGLDDQEFVVAFDTDDPAEFLDLVHELRATESSAYTKSETPIFTCIGELHRAGAAVALDGEAVGLARVASAPTPLRAAPQSARLHARASMRLAGLALGAVHRLPSGVAHGLRLPLREQRLHRLAVGVGRRGQLLSVEVLEQRRDRLLGVALVGADDAGGTALDPADGVLAGPLQRSHGRSGSRRPSRRAERPGSGCRGIRSSGTRRPAVELLGQLGGARPHRSALVLDQLVVDDPDALDALAAEDLHRRDEEAQRDPAALAERLARGGR